MVTGSRSDQQTKRSGARLMRRRYAASRDWRPRTPRQGVAEMRKKNPRLVMVGFVMLAMAAAFFLFMLTLAGRSTDPAAMMSTVGTVSGVVTGIGLWLIAL